MLFEKPRDYTNYVRARETIARQIPVSAIRPRSPNVYSGCRQLDHLTEMETEIQWIGLCTLHHGYQRRRED